MTDYTEKIAVSQLVGASPGYIGYEEGGQLTDKVRRKPCCVILFDEIEKANPHIFNILFPILDEGWINDSQGKYVNFTNTVLILTFNIGSQYILDTFIGESKEAVYDIMYELLRKTFHPEFLNRIDECIIFKPLDSKGSMSIVELQMNQVKDRLKQKKINLHFTGQGVKLLAKLGYNHNFGGRSLKRVIQKFVENEIVDKILQKDIKMEDTVIVDAKTSSVATNLTSHGKLIIRKLESDDVV